MGVSALELKDTVAHRRQDLQCQPHIQGKYAALDVAWLGMDAGVWNNDVPHVGRDIFTQMCNMPKGKNQKYIHILN